MIPALDRRPVIVAIAGSNGAGKTTFYYAYIQQAGLRLINADVLVRELNLDVYPGANLADAIRRQFVEQRESFAFETVFSDPVGDKLSFLKEAASNGYTIVLCFIGISGAEISTERVALRVSRGGHDVPVEKLVARFPRTLANLKIAIRELQHVLIFDNDDLRVPFRHAAAFEYGRQLFLNEPIPAWLAGVLA